MKFLIFHGNDIETINLPIISVSGYSNLIMKTRLFQSGMMYTVLRLGLGSIFLYSGFSKILDLNAFAEVIDAFGIIPWELKHIAAILISAAEVLVGGGLILEIKGALTAILIMLLGFVLVLSWGFYMGYDIDCGCFGENDPVGEAFHGLKSSLIRDGAFLAVVLYLYLWRYVNRFQQKSPLHYFAKIYLSLRRSWPIQSKSVEFQNRPVSAPEKNH